MFHCADELEKTLDGSGIYYESLGLEDAFHPQTILAYEMNDAVLPIPHGAPLRLQGRAAARLQDGQISDADRGGRKLCRAFGGGRGGFWEDRGYEWYTGI